MNGLQVLLYVYIALAFVMYRNLWAYAVRAKAIHLTSAEAKRRIDARLKDWDSVWTEYDEGPSYMQVMFDVRKWTFKQVYPGLATKAGE